MATELFGIALAPLYFAIAQVESTGGRDARADGNIYQIREIYIDDLNRIYTYHRDWYDTVHSKIASEHAMYDYWRIYAYKYAKETGKPITAEILARIHNGGPRGWERKCTKKYWEQVKQYLPKEYW